LVPAHPGSPGLNPESRKMVIVVVVVVYLSGAGLPRLFWKKRPLNGCSSSNSSSSSSHSWCL